MQKKINQTLIDNIVKNSEDSNALLKEDIKNLLDICAKQEKEIIKLKKQRDLKYKKDIKKDKMLEQQSKMAAMGEMMDAVAHQWKQPLNSVSMMSDMLKNDFKEGIVDQKYIDEMTYTADLQIEHLVNTLSEFRNFFRPSDDSEKLFYLSDCISSVQILMKDELLSHNVILKVDVEYQLQVYGLENEFKHLFLNLISNSVDAFTQDDEKEKTINIRAYTQNTHTYIEFEDNAGGVSKSVIKNIFKPNITTKEEGKGTGIGLYMSSQIVQKYHGKIDVHNSDMGALFTITLH